MDEENEPAVTCGYLLLQERDKQQNLFGWKYEPTVQ